MKREDVQNILVMGKSGAGKQSRIDVLLEEFGLEQLSTGEIFRYYMRIFNECGFKGDLAQFWDSDLDWFRDVVDIVEMLGENCKGRMKEVLMGLKAKYFVDSGKYVPDRITNSLFKDYVSRSNYRCKVMDGFPRTPGQAKFLMELASRKKFNIDFAILVYNSDESIKERLLGRRICPKCKKVYHLEFEPPTDGRYCIACGSEVIIRSDDTEEKIRSRLNEFTEKTEPAIEYLKNNNLKILSVPGHLDLFTPENVRRSVMEQVEKILD
ncbi:MAG: nucleoside monophosphate kinase [bacterium]|nr:nucleoside monophosphate kinase [bacterium]